jgi:hypothetical protein
MGYILEHLQDMWNLSDSFFAICEARIGKSKRYLYKPPTHEKMVYNHRWRLIVPNNLIRITAGGVDEYADV